MVGGFSMSKVIKWSYLNSTISTNHALRGGGIATVNSATGSLIVRSLLVANEITEAGGGIINGASHTTLINVTVGGNRATMWVVAF